MKFMEDSSREQSSRKRYADDPRAPDDTSAELAHTENKSKRAREQEMVELNFCSANFLCCDDLEYLYLEAHDGGACGTCSIFTPSDDCQKIDLCTADSKCEILSADGFSLDEIWTHTASIYQEKNPQFMENAGILSDSTKACPPNMEKVAEEEFNEENEVHKWLLTGEDSPSYTANSLNYCTEKEKEACCIGS